MQRGWIFEAVGQYGRGVVCLVAGLFMLPVVLIGVGALDLDAPLPAVFIVLAVPLAIGLVFLGARDLVQRRSEAGRDVSRAELRDFVD